MLLNLSWPAVSLKLFNDIRLTWHTEWGINHMLDYKSTDLTVKSVSIITGGWKRKVEEGISWKRTSIYFHFYNRLQRQTAWITHNKNRKGSLLTWSASDHICAFTLIISKSIHISQQSFMRRFFTNRDSKEKEKTQYCTWQMLISSFLLYLIHPSLAAFFQNRIWCCKEDRWGVTCQWAVKTDSEGAVDAG